MHNEQIFKNFVDNFYDKKEYKIGELTLKINKHKELEIYANNLLMFSPIPLTSFNKIIQNGYGSFTYQKQRFEFPKSTHGVSEPIKLTDRNGITYTSHPIDKKHFINFIKNEKQVLSIGTDSKGKDIDIWLLNDKLDIMSAFKLPNVISNKNEETAFKIIEQYLLDANNQIIVQNKEQIESILGKKLPLKNIFEVDFYFSYKQYLSSVKNKKEADKNNSNCLLASNIYFEIFEEFDKGIVKQSQIVNNVQLFLISQETDIQKKIFEQKYLNEELLKQNEENKSIESINNELNKNIELSTLELEF